MLDTTQPDYEPREPEKHYVDARSPGWEKHIIENIAPDSEIVQLVERLRELYELKPGWKLIIESRGRNYARVDYWKRTQPQYLEYVVE